MHLEQPADALALALGGVERIAARVEGAGVDAEVSQLADVRVRLNLEHQCRERRGRIGFAHFLFVGLRVDARHRRNVERRRQIVDDRVEHRLHALVLQS